MSKYRNFRNGGGGGGALNPGNADEAAVREELDAAQLQRRIDEVRASLQLQQQQGRPARGADSRPMTQEDSGNVTSAIRVISPFE